MHCADKHFDATIPLEGNRLITAQMLAKGFANRAIAKRIIVSDGAVHAYVDHLCARYKIPKDNRTVRRVILAVKILQDPIVWGE